MSELASPHVSSSTMSHFRWSFQWNFGGGDFAKYIEDLEFWRLLQSTTHKCSFSKAAKHLTFGLKFDQPLDVTFPTPCKVWALAIALISIFQRWTYLNLNGWRLVVITIQLWIICFFQRTCKIWHWEVLLTLGRRRYIGPRIYRVWHLAVSLIRILNCWPCRQVFAAWHLALISINLWWRSIGPVAFRIWLLVTSLINRWQAWGFCCFNTFTI